MARHDYTRGGEGQATALPHDQVMQVLEDLRDYCGPKYQVLFATQYFTAGRISEVRTLELRDIDWSQNRIHFRGVNTKTGKARDCAIAPPLARLLRPWWQEREREGDQYLFPGRPRTKAVGLQHCADMLYRIADLRGIRGLSTHSFRRSMATHLRQVQGYEYEEIAVITGHQSVDSLVRYINVREPEVFDRFCRGWD
jgi:integrase/recombinase XerD